MVTSGFSSNMMQLMFLPEKYSIIISSIYVVERLSIICGSKKSRFSQSLTILETDSAVRFFTASFAALLCEKRYRRLNQRFWVITYFAYSFSCLSCSSSFSSSAVLLLKPSPLIEDHQPFTPEAILRTHLNLLLSSSSSLSSLFLSTSLGFYGEYCSVIISKFFQITFYFSVACLVLASETCSYFFFASFAFYFEDSSSYFFFFSCSLYFSIFYLYFSFYFLFISSSFYFCFKMSIQFCSPFLASSCSISSLNFTSFIFLSSPMNNFVNKSSSMSSSGAMPKNYFHSLISLENFLEN